MVEPDGTPTPRHGSPPCRRCPKVPAEVRAAKQRAGGKVTPADALDPEPRHRLAVAHFLECDAVGRFPRDGWVRRHAALLRPMARDADRRGDRAVNAELLRLLRRLDRA